MKIPFQTRSRLLAGLTMAAAVVLWLAWPSLLPREPVWKGHRLSEWLDAHDSNARFDEGDGRRSQFSDEEIREAIDGIGEQSLPFLRQWLTAKPGRLKPWLNRVLNHQTWIRFRFGDDRDLRSLAETGFMVYGTDAQPLLPELVGLSHSPDPETRSLAYEAAFFTRPEREVFLPLAHRASSEKDKGVQAMTAQWMAERFPAEAERAGLHSRFPEFFENQPSAVDAPICQP